MSRTKWPILSVRLPPEVKAAFERFAEQNGLNTTEAIRILLTKVLSGDNPLAMEATIQQNANRRAYAEVTQAVAQAIERFQ